MNKAYAHVVVKTSNLVILRRCYAEVCKKYMLKCVQHVQHNYFSNRLLFCGVVVTVAVIVFFLVQLQKITLKK